MKFQKIKTRSILFTYDVDSEWELNLHLITAKKYNYVIDTGLGSLSVEPIKQYINKDNKPTIVINTHFHWDHVWGNSSYSDCMILSHKLCRDLIRSEWDSMIKKNGQHFHGIVDKCLPNLVFESELYFPEDKIRIIYSPGHTIDSISVLDEEDGLINVGDNIGDTVEKIVPSLYCPKEHYYKTLLMYQQLDFDTCISGHNIVLKKDAIDTIRDKLGQCVLMS